MNLSCLFYILCCITQLSRQKLLTTRLDAIFCEKMWTWNWIEYWTYSESYFLNCFASPWGPTQLCQIVPNHEYASYRGKKWILVSWWNQYLGGIKISCSDKYAAILFPSQATNLDMCGQSHSASIHLDTEYVHYWSKVREVFFPLQLCCL